MTSWRDCQGDVWTEGDDGLLHTKETAPFPREHVERKWGPLVPTRVVEVDPADIAAHLFVRVLASELRKDGAR